MSVWSRGGGAASAVKRRPARKAALTEEEIRRRPTRRCRTGRTSSSSAARRSPGRTSWSLCPRRMPATPSLKERLEDGRQGESRCGSSWRRAARWCSRGSISRISSIVLSKRAERDLGEKVDDKLDEDGREGAAPVHPRRARRQRRRGRRGPAEGGHEPRQLHAGKKKRDPGQVRGRIEVPAEPAGHVRRDCSRGTTK